MGSDARKTCNSCSIIFRRVARLVEVDGLAAKFGEFLEPQEDVGWVKGLRPHALHVDALVNDGLCELPGVVFLRVAGGELGVLRRDRVVGTRFKLWSEVAVAGEGVYEIEVGF